VSNLIYPKIGLRHLPLMFCFSLAGALIAGLYGVLHDQITYSISEEYFTRLKFDQFRYADFGQPRRMFVAEIGFLATWWVGFATAWFLSRIAVPVWPAKTALSHVCAGCATICLNALLGGFAGYVAGLFQNGVGSLGFRAAELDVHDIAAFVRVAYIHNAGYLGALVGCVIAIVRLRKIRDRGGVERD
jgi:hypothetical protein